MAFGQLVIERHRGRLALANASLWMLAPGEQGHPLALLFPKMGLSQTAASRLAATRKPRKENTSIPVFDSNGLSAASNPWSGDRAGRGWSCRIYLCLFKQMWEIVT
jgi:hypothetical protein